ncbi:HNH endonuclease signature motif containing protein [Mesorhizobium sp. B2-7-2]|uniref:HNH endonuclease n=1 Tax=Mesorhizobium sp. B2-7-2 TaxID=2589908 RepID=UPI00112EB5B5|nr:HNH endonuclease signature motif containing protein [Mesorhizobium sp. B2-7-2]TPJ28025.1 HNH endonuclease [Mesorhizobium sp. B2-7-2]
MGVTGKNGRAGYHVYRSRRWVALRQAARRRDDFRCTECGERGRLEVHHKIPVRQAPELAFDLGNLTCLCPPCHIRLERGLTKPTAASIAWRNLLKGTANVEKC